MSLDQSHSSALAHLDKIRLASDEKLQEPGDHASVWLERLGVPLNSIEKIKAIKIVGVKEGSSVGEFTESILRRMRPGWKIGRFQAFTTGRCAVREQISINGQHISEELFTKCFFGTWLWFSDHHPNELQDHGLLRILPGYPLFLSLFVHRAFVSEGVDVAIVEVDAEMSYDLTDIVFDPIVVSSGAETTIAMAPPEILDMQLSAMSLYAFLLDVFTNVYLILGLQDQEDATLAVHTAKAFFDTIDTRFKLSYSSPPLPTSFIIGLERARLKAIS
ncbi:Folylpolyglutamate synthase, mitochondrial [Leucoagaricus sp. SymC.cos]|nr:Folylpolyglutamate synthase, mitochondrial [Leucoagaricus sp. SymC.cos]